MQPDSVFKCRCLFSYPNISEISGYIEFNEPLVVFNYNKSSHLSLKLLPLCSCNSMFIVQLKQYHDLMRLLNLLLLINLLCRIFFGLLSSLSLQLQKYFHTFHLLFGFLLHSPNFIFSCC